MLDVVKKDPVTPAPAERASSLRPRAEEPIGVPAPNKTPTSEPEEAAPSEEWALVQRRRPPAPPGFTLSWVDESGPTPLEEVDWPVSIPLRAQLDLTSLSPCRWPSLTTRNGQGMISVPNPDIPTTDLAWTLRPTWLLSTDWRALSKHNTL